MRILVSIFVLLVVAAGVYMYARPSEQPVVEAPQSSGNPVAGIVSADSAESYDVLVTFDGEEFSPKELTVKKGTRVRFLNTSNESVWPASAVHPTHSIYPEKDTQNCLGSSFDACRGLAKDEFFDFTFQHVGEWRYHDHIKAFKTGVVTVTE